MIRLATTGSLLAIALSLPALSVPALAQETSPQAAEAAASTGIADIIVTANRRVENVQKSSLAIEVVGGDMLASAGVSKVADLQNVVPSLSSAASGANISTYIRGVGSFSTDANADSSIAYNINGVFISRPNGVGAVFFDLDRVEVLKGPQGTLYGRNASGGAINLITRRPGKEFSSDVSVDIGNYDLVRVSAAMGGPVSDTFGVRAAVQYAKHDGYLTDGYNDQDDMSARLSALWEPSPDISLLVVGEYTHQEGQGSGPVFRSLLQPQPDYAWTGPSQAPPPLAAALGPDKIATNGFLNSTIYAISAELNWDLGPAKLTFLPAYRNTRPHTLTYQPGFYFDTAETAEQQSYELRLSNDGDRLKWVIGGYYFDEDQTQDYTLLARPIQQNRVITQLGTKSYAAFGQATFSVNDAFRLIGGLRYSEDKKRQDGTSLASLPFPIITDNYGRRSDDNISFKAGAEFDVAPENMLFATVSTGYKAGGFFPSVLATSIPGRDDANQFRPEKITAYTMGSRNRFLDNNLQVNLEGFYWKYQNKQERFLGALPSGGTGLFTTNAGRATLYGANIDVIAKLGAGTLRVNAEYLHTNYDEFTFVAASSGTPPNAALGYSPLATSCGIGPTLPTPNPAVYTNLLDCSGKPLPHAPKWTGSVSYSHPIELGNGDRIIPSASMKFASSMWLSPDFIKSAYDDGYATFDADLTYDAKRFSVTLWGRNLTKQAIYSGGFRYPFSVHENATGLPPFAAKDPTLFYADIRPPRTYGVTLRAKFGN